MIEAYVRSLDAAIGDRLPAAVKAQRLRESEGHLRMSAAELNQLEAIRRYGPARAVANGMVRVHRGYETASGWRLSIPILVCALLVYVVQFTLSSLLPGQTPFLYQFWLLTFVAMGPFVFRVAQTRRWLFLPVLVERLALTAAVTCLFSQSGISHVICFEFLVTMFRAAIIYSTLNALTLGISSLTDRWRVGHA